MALIFLSTAQGRRAGMESALGRAIRNAGLCNLSHAPHGADHAHSLLRPSSSSRTAISLSSSRSAPQRQQIMFQLRHDARHSGHRISPCLGRLVVVFVPIGFIAADLLAAWRMFISLGYVLVRDIAESVRDIARLA